MPTFFAPQSHPLLVSMHDATSSSLLPNVHSITLTVPDQNSFVRRSEHATHLLPSQGRSFHFVHHNTLHSFEELALLKKAVRRRWQTLRLRTVICRKPRYRSEMARDAFRSTICVKVLIGRFGRDRQTNMIASFVTRYYSLRLAMLQDDLAHGARCELPWLLAETKLLKKIPR